MQSKPANDLKETIRDWWAAYPMTYGLDHGGTSYAAPDGTRVSVAIGSREFYEMADKTFYSWNAPRHNEHGYFGKIFDYARYVNRPILEVGCGMGCMAMNWAMHNAHVTAVDLNPVAVAQTRRRFAAFGLPGEIREADAEHLPFADNAFDFAYSWGVLHHTPNTGVAIRELWRVLRPGGRVGVMLYHRRSLLYRYLVEYAEGLLNMESEFLNPLELASRYADGGRAEGNPHTWPVTKTEAREVLFRDFQNVTIDIFGTDLPFVLNLLRPGLGERLPRALLEACARRWGWSLWITGDKKD